MYELISVTENDFYIDCPSKIGLVRVSGNDFAAIDSGNDRDAGKKVLRAVRAQGWNLTAIYNTHGHADHIGGNRYLFDQTGCRIYAAGVEQAATRFPIFEPYTLCAAYPPKELRNKFLLAQESPAELLTEAALPSRLRAVPLPGHTAEMTGFLTDDGTFYVGDAVSSEETLRKYALTYQYDLAAALQTLAWLETAEASCFVPSHAPACADIAPLARKNAETLRANAEEILSLCREPVTFEELLKRLFDRENIPMSTGQFYLIGSTLRSYLTWLCDIGRAAYTFSDNRMLFTAVED